MMKDITKQVMEQTPDKYELNIDVDNILAHVFGQALKDLYKACYDLKEEQAKANASKTKIKNLKSEIKDIIEYFDTPFYKAHTDKNKNVWLNWIAEMLKKPRIKIGQMIDDIMFADEVR